MKTANGIKTIPPQRRDSDDDLIFTPASVSPAKAASLAASRHQSPIPLINSTKYIKHCQVNSSHGIKNVAASSAVMSKKRPNNNFNDEYLPPSKIRCRGKKPQSQKTLSGLKTERHFNHEAPDSVTGKRRLHNDMERQRRVQLKRQFETLKQQIPGISHTDRVPKVKILKEATKYCHLIIQEYRRTCIEVGPLKMQLQRNQEKFERLGGKKAVAKVVAALALAKQRNM